MDRLLLATLTLCLTLGGAVAIGADLRRDASQATAARTPVVVLERVVVTGKRLDAPAAVAVTERNEPATQRAE